MAILKNQTTGKIISENMYTANSMLEKICGLINPRVPRFLIINTRFGIHTFFMKAPIDVILVDKSSSVARLKENLKPNNFYFYNPIFNMVIEMPKGTIKRNQIKINDKISIE